MTKTSRRFHSFMISILLSILVWVIVNKYVVPIGLWDFIFIEIIIAISELFSTFVKEKAGLKTPETDPKSSQVE